MAKQLIIIDPSVSNYDQLLAGINGDYDLLVLNQSQDGIQQIAIYLQGKSGYDAIQVFSHGSSGALYLGSTVVNNSNLAEYQAQLQQIGSALTDTGDVLLYGCKVAEGEEGNRFINSLAEYTGTDIAASMDLTGSSALGGNWDLEKVIGFIELSSYHPVNKLNGLLMSGLTGTVSFNGIEVQGETLTAWNDLAYPDHTGLISYMWLADWEPIGWSSTLKLTQEQVGKTIQLVATYSYFDNGKQWSWSTQFDDNYVTVENINDSPTGNVIITNTPIEFHTLIVSNNLGNFSLVTGKLIFQ